MLKCGPRTALAGKTSNGASGLHVYASNSSEPNGATRSSPQICYAHCVRVWGPNRLARISRQTPLIFQSGLHCPCTQSARGKKALELRSPQGRISGRTTGDGTPSSGRLSEEEHLAMQVKCGWQIPDSPEEIVICVSLQDLLRDLVQASKISPSQEQRITHKLAQRDTHLVWLPSHLFPGFEGENVMLIARPRVFRFVRLWRSPSTPATWTKIASLSV